MKIAFCLHHFLPEYIAGTEVYVYNLAFHLQKNGIQAIVIIPNLGVDNTEEYLYEGTRVIKYAENSIEDRSMILGKTAPDGLAVFETILAREMPDIVHFHELAPGRGINIFHVESVYAMGIPIVLTFHLASYTCIKGSLVYKDVEKCNGVIDISRCTECVYQSKKIEGKKLTLLHGAAMTLFKAGINTTGLNHTAGTALGFPFVIDKIKKDLERLAGLSQKIIVLTRWYKAMLIENGVPADKLEYIKQGLTNDSAIVPNPVVDLPLKLVFLGRISPLKGLHLLIEAVKLLPEGQVMLSIYGQETADNYSTHCKQQAANNANIVWKGAILPSMVVTELSGHHLLCLPSTFSEMSPLVIQEAFAAGIPVLASDVYGNAEQVEEGVNGWLFRFNDSEHLYTILKRLITDPGLLRLAKQQLPIARTFKTVAEAHAVLYNQVSMK